MTQAYALRKLLEHGPLTFSEMWAITGWEKEQVQVAIDTLTREKAVCITRENFRFNTRFGLAA